MGTGGLDFTGRVALVTGAAAGLGRAIAAGFAAHGADIAVCDRNADGLAELVAEVEATGRRVHHEVLDVRDGDAVDRFVTATTAALGRLDVVVNNAGGTFRSLFAEVNAKGQAALVDENFTSVTHVIRAALPHLGAGASIVNVTSIEAHRAAPGYAVYSAMKAAVENLSRSLALELGDRGIRVNVIAPDAIPTAAELFLGEQTTGGSYEHTTPLGRLGTPADVVGPALFLASPLSGFMTGTTLHVDGGNNAARGWRRQPDGTFRP